MISSVRQAEILQQVRDVLMDYSDGFPVNPMKIAAKVDITVKAFPSEKPGISGFLLKVGDHFGIGYSEAIANKGFQNFTVAHELGHYFLSGHADALLMDDKPHYSKSGFISKDPYEQEADFFASELLMPKGAFRDRLQTAGEGFEAIEKLATFFQTSLVATAIRFAQHGEDPIAVILSCGERVEFCVLSDALKERNIKWIARGDSVPKESATFAFNQRQENIRSAKCTKGTSILNAWFEGVLAVEMKEDVIGLGHYGRTLTVLFTEEAIDDEDEADYDQSHEMPSARWARRDRERHLE